MDYVVYQVSLDKPCQMSLCIRDTINIVCITSFTTGQGLFLCIALQVLLLCACLSSLSSINISLYGFSIDKDIIELDKLYSTQK